MSLNFENVDLGSFGIREQEQPLEPKKPSGQFNLNNINPGSLDQGTEVDAMRGIVTEAVKKDPAAGSKNTILAREVGAPVTAVTADPAAIEQKAKLNKIDFRGIAEHNPQLSKMLLDPEKAVTAQNDIEPLRRLENLLTTAKDYAGDIEEAFGKGQAQVESAELGLQGMYHALDLGEPLSEAQVARSKELEAQMMTPVDERGFFAGAPIAAAQQLPIMGEILLDGMMGAVGGGALGATSGALAGVTVAGPPGALAGAVTFGVPAAKIGGRIGVAKGAFDLEAGLAFNEFSTMTDDEGNVMDTQIAAYAATAVGAVNAGLESLSLAALGRTVTPAMRMLVRSRVKRALLNETGRASVMKVARSYMEAIATESITEGLQEFTNVMGSEFAKVMDEGSFTESNFETAIDNVFSMETAERVGESAYVGAQATIVLGAPGTVATAYMDRQQRVKLSEDEQAQIDELNNIAKETELKKNDPEQFKEFVGSVSGDTDVFIKGEQVAEYLQSKTTDEIAENPALETLNKQIQDAKVLGGDVVIPVDEFTAYLADTEAYDALRPAMSLTEEGMKPIDQEQDIANTDEYIKELMDEANENVSQYVEAQDIYNATREQLIDTGMVSPENAATLAQVMPAWAMAYSKKNGITVQEAFDKAGLTIEGPMTGKPKKLSPEAIEQAQMERLKGIEVKTTATVEETGEVVDITESGDVVYTRSQERVKSMENMINCLRG